MLTEQNIEQYLFDYHEGTLDASQKVELMEFLHQHPEWQRDFAIWAQVHLQDEPVVAPALQKKLVKSIAPQFPIWYSGLMAGATVAVGTALLVWYLGGTTQSTTPASQMETTPTVLPSPNVAPYKEMEQMAKKEEEQLSVKTEQNEHLLPKKEKREEAPALQKPSVLPTDLPKEAIVLKDTVQIPVTKEQKTEVISSVPETIEEDPEDPAPEAAPKKKKKRLKQKISLKPTSDIIPSNSNF